MGPCHVTVFKVADVFFLLERFRMIEFCVENISRKRKTWCINFSISWWLCIDNRRRKKKSLMHQTFPFHGACQLTKTKGLFPLLRKEWFLEHGTLGTWFSSFLLSCLVVDDEGWCRSEVIGLSGTLVGVGRLYKGMYDMEFEVNEKCLHVNSINFDMFCLQKLESHDPI